MYCKVNSGTLHGINGIMIDVEVDIAEGFPKLDLVGGLSSTVKEAKERVRTGIRNAGFKFPYKRITINLAPAHIRKEGVAFDLAIAVGVLICEKVLEQRHVEGTLLIGELALNGRVRPVKGVLSIVDKAKAEGLLRCFVPAENANEALLVRDIEVVGIRDLAECVGYLREDSETVAGVYRRMEAAANEWNINYDCRKKTDRELDFSQVIGQKKAKRGLEIAVSGMHHAMLVGPPGIGKTMLARRIRTILPPMSHREILELTKIYSAAEKLMSSSIIIKERPFRDPHHSVTRASFIGGGISGKPGEISLAHQGVLMLDEFPEFKRDVIESLREPLEQGNILLSRNQQVYSFPADFMLIAAMNPCPCGHYPNLEKCRCLPSDIDRYQGKVSGPILDRIDLHVEMSPEPYDKLVHGGEEESSRRILERVSKATCCRKNATEGRGFDTIHS